MNPFLEYDLPDSDGKDNEAGDAFSHAIIRIVRITAAKTAEYTAFVTDMPPGVQRELLRMHVLSLLTHGAAIHSLSAAMLRADVEPPTVTVEENFRPFEVAVRMFIETLEAVLALGDLPQRPR